MKNYLYIALGGLTGAILRYMIKDMVFFGYYGSFPLNTFITNISGGFILGIFLTMGFDFYKVKEEIRLGIATGFLGAYTTFSTLCRENILLIQQGKLLLALLYPASSLLFGILATLAGIIIAEKLNKRIAGVYND